MELPDRQNLFKEVVCCVLLVLLVLLVFFIFVLVFVLAFVFAVVLAFVFGFVNSSHLPQQQAHQLQELSTKRFSPFQAPKARVVWQSMPGLPMSLSTSTRKARQKIRKCTGIGVVYERAIPIQHQVH